MLSVTARTERSMNVLTGDAVGPGSWPEKGDKLRKRYFNKTVSVLSTIAVERRPDRVFFVAVGVKPCWSKAFY